MGRHGMAREWSRLSRYLLLFFCCLGGLLPETAACAAPALKLFGSVEFRGSLDALPGWVRVTEQAQRQVEALARCDSARETCPPAAISWQQIMKMAAGRSRTEQLKAVNAFFNRWPYRLDQDVFGRSDYWATPLEFMTRSGDCEDFCIAKYYALRQLGFPAESLRIVVLRDTIRGIGHAVLVAYLHEEAYVLDNLSDLVLSHADYGHYVPQYSVNELSRWAHIRPLKRSGDLNRIR